MTEQFSGAKGAIVARGCVVTLLRDDRPGLDWPGWWDLPGGGRDGVETAWACFVRETYEETGIDLPRAALRWRSAHLTRGRSVLFFGAVLPALCPRDLRLGAEGQALRLMPVGRFIRHPRAIPALRARVAAFCATLP